MRFGRRPPDLAQPCVPMGPWRQFGRPNTVSRLRPDHRPGPSDATGTAGPRRHMRAQAVRRAKSGMLDDDDLQQLILERFDEDPAFWTGTGKSRVGITVEVDDGHVRLSGVVRSALDRRRADILAPALCAPRVGNPPRRSDEGA